MSELFNDCDISVCPYIDATQSGVINTSYSLSKPVVATNVGGLPEMVVDGKTGILVPPKNSQILAEAIVELLKDEKKLEMMQEYIENVYYASSKSWQEIANKYIAFYKTI